MAGRPFSIIFAYRNEFTAFRRIRRSCDQAQFVAVLRSFARVYFCADVGLRSDGSLPYCSISPLHRRKRYGSVLGIGNLLEFVGDPAKIPA
jgi:hypothetical protein